MNLNASFPVFTSSPRQILATFVYIYNIKRLNPIHPPINITIITNNKESNMDSNKPNMPAFAHPLSKEQQRNLKCSQIRLPVRASEGTHYPCTQEDIDDYRVLINHKDPFRLMSLGQSTTTLWEFLTQQISTPVEEALSRLHTARWKPESGLDTIIKVAYDVDTAFFNSQLRGNIAICWSDTHVIRKRILQTKKHYNNVLGVTFYEQEDLCTVYLNADTILRADDPRHQMWETLLHEFTVRYAQIEKNLEPSHVQILDILTQYAARLPACDMWCSESQQWV